MVAKESVIDLNRGLVFQVWKLGDGYDAWVHDWRSRQRELNRMGKAGYRMFDTPIVELASLTPWYIVPLVWVPVIVAILLSAAPALPPAEALALFSAGVVVAWPLMEYLLHRHLFHMQPSGPVTRTLHFLLHGIHHVAPCDPLHLVFPPPAAAIIAALLYAGFRAVLPSVEVARVAFAGLLVGYVGYDLCHYLLHHPARSGPLAMGWVRALRRAHMAHHFHTQSTNYGITSPLFDVVFGTLEPTPATAQCDGTSAKAE